MRGLSHNEPVADPRQDYQTRLAARQALVAALSIRDARAAALRLITFALFACAAVAAGRGFSSWWWLVLPAGLFLALMQWHDTVLRARDAALRAVEYYERGLARMDDRW